MTQTIENEPLRLLIADDHAVIRVGLVSMLCNEHGIEVVAEAKDGNEAISLYRRWRPDIALLDVRMPTMDGIETLRMLLDEFPDAKVVMLSSAELEDEVATAMTAGAMGYLPKSSDVDGYVDALRKVAAGGKHFSPALAEQIEHRAALSNRELEVLQGMARGETNQQIAATLFLSEHTVKTYAKGTLAKLQVEDRAGAVAVGFAKGILKIS